VKSTYPAENSVLLMQFRQFCSELLRLRKMVELRYPLASSQSATPPTQQPENAFHDWPDALTEDPGQASVTDSSKHDPFTTPASPAEEVRQSLISLLEQQSDRSSDLGGALGLGLYREAQYVMAALADEIFLNASWSERDRWPLLEQELFHTHSSGDLFFQKIDRLLAGKSSRSTDLAMIYFQALSLDFRGRYRGSDPQHQLTRYRHQLYFRIFQTGLEDGAHAPVFLEAYSETATETEGRRLPSPHLWWFVLAGVCALWIFASTLLWHHVTFDIRQQIEQIRTFSRLSEGSIQ
jgi:type VI secretion system protein ImpK